MTELQYHDILRIRTRDRSSIFRQPFFFIFLYIYLAHLEILRRGIMIRILIYSNIIIVDISTFHFCAHHFS